MTEQPHEDSSGDAGPFRDSEATDIYADVDTPARIVLREPGETMASPAGSGVGRYQLLEEIGRGGIGAVFKGKDLDLGRDLAVKVLLERHQENADLVRRFLEEAQVGGQLQHPGIVPVYELGRSPDSRPFFTMKLVQGRTLAALLAERQSPTDDLPRFLAIFQQVCQTIAYAHSRAVIHRDLKPSNIMVGAFGEVQVMDWGLAKVLGSTPARHPAPVSPAAESPVHTARSDEVSALSQVGTVLGTPAYMAPEQARGEVEQLDERCDVFGLGAILCEILTGRPPYLAAQGDVLRQATRADLVDAGARLEASGADAPLVALAHRCLAPDPAVRPRDADAVAREMESYRASVQERLRSAELEAAAARARAAHERKVRRLTVGLTASVLALLLLGAGTWAWLAWTRAERQERTTRDVEDALSEATQLWAEAKAAPVGQLLAWEQAQAAADRAAALLAAGEATEATRGRVRDFVIALQAEEAAARKAAEEAERDRTMLRSLAEARRRRTAIRDGRFDNEAAALTYERAFRTYGIDVLTLSPQEAANQLRTRAIQEDLIAALDSWGICIEGRGAQRLHIFAVAKAADPEKRRDGIRDALARHDWETVRRLVAQAPLEPFPLPMLGLLGDLLAQIDPLVAVAFLKRVQHIHPDDFFVNHALGWAFEDLGQWDQAVRYYTAAVALGPSSPGAYLNLAHALHGKHDRDGAIEALREAIRLKHEFPQAHHALGTHLYNKGDCTGAVAAYREAIRQEPTKGSHHRALADALAACKQVKEAVTEYREAARLLPKSADASFNLANLFLREKEYDQAIASYQEAIRREPAFAQAHMNLGTAYFGKGDLDRAGAGYRKAIELDPNLADSYENLGNVLLFQGNEESAIAVYRQLAQRKPNSLIAHQELARLLVKRGRRPEAVASLAAILRLQPSNSFARLQLGIGLAELGELAGAAAALRQYAQHRPEDPIGHYNLAGVLVRQGDENGAIAVLQKAIRVNPEDATAQSRLGHLLVRKRRFDEAIPVLEKARHRDAEDAVTQFALGEALEAKERLAEAAEAYGQAVRLNGADAETHHHLGRVLGRLGRVPQALAAYAEAVRLDPKNPHLHAERGRLLGPLGRIDEALAAFRKAIELKPDLAEAHQGLGLALSEKRAYAEAIAAFEKALLLQPGFVEARTELARARAGQGDLDGAIADLRETLRVRPQDAQLHYNLGNALREKGRLGDAADAFRAAFGLRPNFAEARCNRGLILQQQGRFEEALADLRRGHELGAQQPNWRYPSRQWLVNCARLLELDKKLPDILDGKVKPADTKERLELAFLCQQYRQHYLAAARLFDEALATEPKLAEALQQGIRYRAACAAAQAGGGLGDARELDDKERARWRQRARDWLQADLAAWQKQFEKRPPEARQALRHWKNDPALAGLRDEVACGNLSQAEREACRKLWEEISSLLRRDEPGDRR